MPFNGSGTYSPPSPPTFPAVSGTKIRSSYFNSVINDLATALSNCVARDGQSTITNAMTFLGIDAQDVTATSFSVDTFFTSLLVGGNPVQKFDDKDYLSYDRTNNLLKIRINDVEEFGVSTADGPYRTDDASTGNGLVRKSQMDTAVPALETTASDGTYVSTSATKAATPQWIRGLLGLGFASSFGANGYVKFPSWLGGFMVAWGAASSYSSPTFALAFPTACYGVMATSTAGSGIYSTCRVGSVSTSGFQHDSSNASNSSIYYLAYGK